MKTWTHDALCLRAKRWLSGTMRCNPTFSNCASCAEIPDAIGWHSGGSIVVECKTSVSDFYADRRKYLGWKNHEYKWVLSYDRFPEKEGPQHGYELVEVPRMGDLRYYMSESGIVKPELVEKHAPDHGLVYVVGNIVRVIREAQQRELVNKDSEIRFLRFAIINDKTPHLVAEAQAELVQQ